MGNGTSASNSGRISDASRARLDSGESPRILSDKDKSPRVTRQSSKLAQNIDGIERVKDYHFGRCFGRGAFGKVQSVQRKRCNNWFAAKMIDLKQAAAADPKLHAIVSEVSLLIKISGNLHPFIINLHYGMLENDCLYMILDLSNSGSLEDYLLAKPDCHMSEETVRFYIANLLLALDCLHQKGIIHRDVKPDNLLFADNGYLQLTDYGISSATTAKKTTCNMKSGTVPYMAPEMFCKVPRHNYLVDIYASGITAFELLYKKVPYERGLKQAAPFIEKAKADKLASPPEGYDFKFMDLEASGEQPSDDCKEALNLMTHIFPWCRLGDAGGMKGGVKEVLAHAFFDDIDCEALLAQTVPAPIKPDDRGGAVAQQQEDVLDLFADDGDTSHQFDEKQLATMKALKGKLEAHNKSKSGLDSS